MATELAAAASAAASDAGRLVSLDTEHAIAHYILWLVATLFIPVVLPVVVLWAIDVVSLRDTRKAGTTKLVRYATKDGQLLWVTMAVCAAGCFEVLDSSRLDLLVKVAAVIIFAGEFCLALVWVVWWTMANHLKAAAREPLVLSANEAVLVKGSTGLTVACVVLFALIKLFL